MALELWPVSWRNSTSRIRETTLDPDLDVRDARQRFCIGLRQRGFPYIYRGSNDDTQGFYIVARVLEWIWTFVADRRKVFGQSPGSEAGATRKIKTAFNNENNN